MVHSSESTKSLFAKKLIVAAMLLSLQKMMAKLIRGHHMIMDGAKWGTSVTLQNRWAFYHQQITGTQELIEGEFVPGNPHIEGKKQSNDHTNNDVSSATPSSKISRSPSGEKSRSSRVKEKVKGFIKLFSPESSPKRKRAPETQGQTSVGKTGSKTELHDMFSMSSLEASEDVEAVQMNNQNAFTAEPFPMAEVQERSDKPVLTANSKLDTAMGSNESASNELIPKD